MGKPRIAWVEEWMSTKAARVLPILAERLEIIYVTGGEEVPRAKFVDVRRVPRPKTMMLGGFGLSRGVDRLYREHAIELAVVYGSIGFAIRHTPYIAVEGGSVYQQIRLMRPRWPRRVSGFVHYALPEIACVRRARHVSATSHSLKADLMRLHHLADARVSVVYHGIDAECRAVYRMRHSAPRRLLYVGRLHPVKGIVAALRAFHERRDLDVEFVVAGDGPQQAAVRELARRDPRICYLGPVTRAELLSLLASCEVFVFPTLHEGFGLALGEAMTAGLTCVTYDIPITRELLGDAGVRVPVGDARALMRRVVEVLEDEPARRCYGAAGHERMRAFTWERCADEVDAVVRAAL